MERVTQLEDRRSTLVKLTKQGEAEFKRVFAPQIAFGKQSFANYDEQDFDALDKELTKLHANLTGKELKRKY